MAMFVCDLSDGVTFAWQLFRRSISCGMRLCTARSASPVCCVHTIRPPDVLHAHAGPSSDSFSEDDAHTQARPLPITVSLS